MTNILICRRPRARPRRSAQDPRGTDASPPHPEVAASDSIPATWNHGRVGAGGGDLGRAGLRRRVDSGEDHLGDVGRTRDGRQVAGLDLRDVSAGAVGHRLQQCGRDHVVLRPDERPRRYRLPRRGPRGLRRIRRRRRAAARRQERQPARGRPRSQSTAQSRARARSHPSAGTDPLLRWRERR